MKTTITRAVSAVILLAALTACSDVKKELGVGRNSPDEFMVVKRAPLTLPPEYDLRPPDTGAVPPASVAAGQAKAVLMGSDAKPAEKGDSETALLSKMGAQNADPNIRAEINRENGFIELENRTLVDKLIFWKDDASGMVESSVVNPKQEAERIKKNQEEGKPANEGDVPVIEKKRSTIDKLF
jgi:hypothetical protein